MTTLSVSSGKERASIGFSLAVDRVLIRCNKETEYSNFFLNKNGSLIVYDAKSSDMALIEAITLRNNGIRAGLYPSKLKIRMHTGKLARPYVYEKITFIENNERKEELVSDILQLHLQRDLWCNHAVDLFEKIGVTCDEIKDKDTRKLIFTNQELKIKFFLSKPSDVPTYVEYGAADWYL